MCPASRLGQARRWAAESRPRRGETRRVENHAYRNPISPRSATPPKPMMALMITGSSLLDEQCAYEQRETEPQE